MPREPHHVYARQAEAAHTPSPMPREAVDTAVAVPLARSTPASARPLPDYLVRHYAWAYLWPSSVWFFDHQPIINAILFGQYRKIMNHTLRMMDGPTAGKTLQIAGVYGELTPKLAEHIDDLHLIDVAQIQLDLAKRKLDAMGKKADLRLMNAEYLEYPDDSFDTAIMFLLLHEMPAEARRRSLTDALRVIRPGGRFVVSEYGEFTGRHILHRFPLFRWVLTFAEPFLGGFWKDDLKSILSACAASVGKGVVLEEEVKIFGGFYRTLRFRVT